MRRPAKLATMIGSRVYRAVPLLLLLLTACSGVAERPNDGAANQVVAGGLRIVTPTGYVFSNRSQSVVGVLERGFDATKPVPGTLVITGPNGEVQLALEGDLRYTDYLNAVGTDWHSEDATPGTYDLALSIDLDGRTHTATSQVTLRHPPTIAIELIAEVPVHNGTEVTLKATAQTAEPGSIESYAWYLGNADQPLAEAPMLNHVLPAGKSTRSIALRARDSLGGESLVTYNLSRGPGGIVFQQARDCGCRQMTVVTDASEKFSGEYCRRISLFGLQSAGIEAVPTPIAKVCPRGFELVRARLGEINPSPQNGPALGFAFEVRADLVDGSDPHLCAEGQLARGRISGRPTNIPTRPRPLTGPYEFPAANPGGTPYRVNGVNYPAPYPLLPMPRPDGATEPAPPVFGADSYTTLGGAKTHMPGGVRWFDVPQAPADRLPHQDTREFISYVMGGTGACWCHVSTHRLLEDPNNPRGSGLAKITGTNCRVR